jgi:hypothetical protein
VHVVEPCIESAINQYEYLCGKDDVSCMNCVLMEVKLNSISQEIKSMQLVIDI